MDQSALALPLPTTTALLPASKPPALNAAAAHKAGQDFESFFLSQVFENMFSGIGTDAMFGGGDGEQVYRSLLLQEYSKVAAKSGGIGIAASVEREILQMQEKQR